jgi:Ca2+-binding RTX toxin-like protein
LGNVDDLLDGGVGNDQLFAGAGNDDLVGGSGNDLMRGNGGADVMAGGGGNDDARGSTGNDTIFGNGGDDYIAGDSGNDTLNAGSGDDTVVGGTGADVFDFRAVASGGGGYNTVKDFTNGQDLLDLSTYGLTFTQINTLMEQRAWGARIEFADGQVIALEGFNKSEFDAGDLL